MSDVAATGSARRVGDVIISVGASTVTAVMDRPDKRNAISYAVIEGLNSAIDTTIDTGASILVLRGAGGNFCAGADLNLVKAMLDDASGLTTYLRKLSDVCDRLADGPFVSLAVVTGFALAGGCELLLACDVAVASEDAQIGDRHLRNSLLPGAGGSVRLFRALTPARARRLLYTAEMISGRVAEDWGLVAAAYPAAALDDQVTRLVNEISARSPQALRAAKAMTVAAERQSLADALAEERRIFVGYATGNESVRTALTAFLDGRSTVQQTAARRLPNDFVNPQS